MKGGAKLGETKIILLSRKWPGTVIQKFRQKLYLLYDKAVGRLVKNKTKG